MRSALCIGGIVECLDKNGFNPFTVQSYLNEPGIYNGERQVLYQIRWHESEVWRKQYLHLQTTGCARGLNNTSNELIGIPGFLLATKSICDRNPRSKTSGIFNIPQLDFYLYLTEWLYIYSEIIASDMYMKESSKLEGMWKKWS
jgi:hypothetical protein